MDMPEVGTKVAVVRSISDNTIYLYGYGKFEGTVEFNVENGPIGLVAELAKKAGISENPKITMEDGTVVWGCECWWCPEDRFKSEYGKMTVVEVDIELDRQKIKESLEEDQ